MNPSKAPRILQSLVCSSCRHRILQTNTRRSFASSTVLRADNDAFSAAFNPGSRASQNAPQRRSDFRDSDTSKQSGQTLLDILDAPTDPSQLWTGTAGENMNAQLHARQRPHRLHVYATKHNTHITFVQPPKAASQTVSSSISSTSASASARGKMIEVLISLSTGNIGFRKAGRGSYDAAYQLSAFVMKQMQEKGMLRDVRRLEIVLRGFGQGREAIQKVILGPEGRFIRDKVVAVMDATRLKFGGSRSPNPRRLG